MSIELNRIYVDYFSDNSDKLRDWDAFRTKKSDFHSWQIFEPDLKSGLSRENWKKTALTILQIMILPWGMYTLFKSLANRFVLNTIYPAQNLPKSELSKWRQEIAINRNLKDGIFRHIRLEKEGKSYSAFLVGKESTIRNGKWVLHTNGNRASIEKECAIEPNYLDSYLKEGLNVLLVNGPGVGFSSPMKTIEDLGNAQELGLLFLESAVKAREIVLTGVSLGAAAQSLAIDRHNFLEDRTYTVIRLATFDRLSHLVHHIAGKLGLGLLSWLGYEIDSVKASKKLHYLGIQEIIFDNDQDPLMKNVAMSKALLKEGVPLENKTIKIVTFQGHYYCANTEIIKAIRESRMKLSIAS